MKSTIAILIFISLSFSSYSQDKNNIYEGDNKNLEFPEVVMTSAVKDFSAYLPGKNADARVSALQEKFSTFDLAKDFERGETVSVLMEIEKGSLVATYDEKGKLTRVEENYKDVILPREVINSIYKTYPGWTITNDKFIYTQENGTVTKNQYNIKIKKGSESRKLVVHSNGDIIGGL